MPYIEPKRRIDAQVLPKDAGELNFGLTKVIVSYLNFKGESYQTYNDIIGALEGAKLEIYRRMIAPYEENKKNQNGDVYG